MSTVQDFERYETVIESAIATCDYTAYGQRDFVEAITKIVPALHSRERGQLLSPELIECIIQLEKCIRTIIPGVDCSTEIERFYTCMQNAYSQYTVWVAQEVPDSRVIDFLRGLTSSERKTLSILLETVDIDVIKTALRNY